MGRFLVAFPGIESGVWQFVGLTAHRSDAELIAHWWTGAEIFDLAKEGLIGVRVKLQFPEWFE